MRMRTSGPVNRSTRYRGGNKVVSFTVAIICLILGFLMFQPFLWFVLIFGKSSHYISFSTFLYIVGLVIGAPMFVFGLANLLAKDNMNGSTSTPDLDISRIRHTVETSKMEKK